MRPISLVLLAFFVVACGPTAQVVTTPTGPPVDTSVPTFPPTPAPSPTPLTSATPIGLNTATPLNLSTPTPIGPPPTAEPTPATSDSPSGPFARLDTFPAEGAMEVTDVAVTPGGFLAVGFGGVNGAASYYSARQGIVWTSVDGSNWIESVDPSLVNVEPISVVSRGSDYFLAGFLSACAGLDDSCVDVPQAGNGIWRSTNGGAWELLAQNPDMQGGFIDDMFLAGDRLVVFGGAGEEEESTLWISQDGVTWTSTTDLSGMDPITSMAIGPAGFSAFGTIYDDSAFDVVLIAATSSDGAHFTTAAAPQLVGTGIDDVAAGPAGMAGVGYHTTDLFDQSGVAVHSADGMNWTESTNVDGTFAGSALQTVHALSDGGYVAIGYTQRDDEFSNLDGAAWFSADGSDWVLIARLDGGFSTLNASALGSTGVVVFASEQIDLPDDDVGSVVHAWFAPLSSI
ncbi:MAG: hypothetical protein QOJ81_2137 [Chloroflexota bacterium]|jgi:hypothetical protein|nr:hypothetical protein [Chloroflexota bacterium]